MAVALLGALLALALLFPATKEMVVVVPSADGHVGMVVVERGDDRVILNEAYATSRVTSDGQIHLEKLQPAEVQSETLQSKTLESATFERTAAPQPALEQVASALPMFHDAIAALPPRPISFLLYFVTGTDDLTEASKLELGRMKQRRPAEETYSRSERSTTMRWRPASARSRRGCRPARNASQLSWSSLPAGATTSVSAYVRESSFIL